MNDQHLREQWTKVCAEFDWEKCAQVFLEKGWVYGTPICGGREWVPTATDLRQGCNYGFETLLRRRLRAECSGRFIIVVDSDGPAIISQALDPKAYLERGTELGLLTHYDFAPHRGGPDA